MLFPGFILIPTPCAKLLMSLAQALSHFAESSPFIRFLHSKLFPVIPTTELTMGIFIARFINWLFGSIVASNTLGFSCSI